MFMQLVECQELKIISDEVEEVFLTCCELDCNVRERFQNLHLFNLSPLVILKGEGIIFEFKAGKCFKGRLF